MAEQVQSGPQQSRARRFLGAGKRTLDGEDRSERIKTGRKGTPFRAFSPTIKPEFPHFHDELHLSSYRRSKFYSPNFSDAGTPGSRKEVALQLQVKRRHTR